MKYKSNLARALRKTSVSTGDKNGKSRNKQLVHYTPSFLQSTYIFLLKKYLYIHNKIKPAMLNWNILAL